MHDEGVISIIMRTCSEDMGRGIAQAAAERLVAAVEVTALAAANHDRLVAMEARK